MVIVDDRTPSESRTWVQGQAGTDVVRGVDIGLDG